MQGKTAGELTREREALLDQQGPELHAHVQGMEERLDKVMGMLGELAHEANALKADIAAFRTRGLLLPDRVYGLEPDDDMPIVSARGLTEVSVAGRENPDKPGTLRYESIDALNSYVMAGVHAILEVPAGENLEPEHVLVIAESCRFDVSLLPPAHDASEADWEAYTGVLCDYARRWVGSPSAREQVFPVSNFFQYLVAEHFGNPPDTVASHPYVIASFVEPLEASRMDAIKDVLRTTIIDALGGKEGFATFCHSVAHASAQTLEQVSRPQS